MAFLTRSLTLWLALVGAVALFGATPADAHPSVSVVVDSTGTIYYSDLNRVWMIKPDGTRLIAVNHVHTHELWIGPDGNVWGDDVQNVGEQYRHRVWKRMPDGSLANALPWRDGHPTEYYDFAFDRDANGLMDVLRRDNTTIEVRNSNNAGGSGVVRTIPLNRSLGFAHWLTVQPDGTVFVTVGSTLLRVEPGSIEAQAVATNLVRRTKAFADLHDRHAIIGIWTSQRESGDAGRSTGVGKSADAGQSTDAGAVFVADFAGQSVRRVDLDGSVTTVWTSEGNWSVTGGSILDDGSMLLLEWSTSNEVRVRHVARDGSSRVMK